MIQSIAAYRFTRVADPHALAAQLRTWAETGALRGTVLVAEEGLNLFLAGETSAIDEFLANLRSDTRFASMDVKASFSAGMPFSRLKVRVKPEIISFRLGHAFPGTQRAPTVSPTELSRWLEQGTDDRGRPLVLLDTRNREEVAYGTFTDALTLPIDNFTELPDAVLARREAFADATVVSFCTGGIRCEKAALWMHEQGMDNVLQLDGGILGYFEATGGKGYTGGCFVFDDRIALDSTLAPISRSEEAESAIGMVVR